MEFKKLEISSEQSWFKRNIWTTHGKKTIFYIVLGALAGFIFYLLSEDTKLASLTWNEVLPNIALGACCGVGVTISPGARNRCY